MNPIDDGFDFIEGVMQALKFFIIPYGAYFVGIYIRNKFLPEKNSPSLKVLMLVGIPVCLIIVSPILIAAQGSLSTVTYAYLMTVGIIMEHGMVVHETVIARINELTNKQKK